MCCMNNCPQCDEIYGPAVDYTLYNKGVEDEKKRRRAKEKAKKDDKNRKRAKP